MAQRFREHSRGDANDQRLQIVELGQQLQDRKQANVILNTENQRLKRQIYDLQQRLADLEMGRVTKRGEASTVGALRLAAANAKQQQLAASQNFGQAMEANQQLVDQLNMMSDQMQALQDQLSTTQGALAAARGEVEVLQGQLEEQQSAQGQLQIKLQATEQSLQDTEAARDQLTSQLSSAHQQLEQERAAAATALQQRLAALAAEHTAELAALAAVKDQEIAARGQEIAARDKQAQEAEAKKQQVSNIAALPESLAAVELPLVGLQQQAATLNNASQGSAAAAEDANYVDLIAHVLSFTSGHGTALYDMWPYLAAEAPGILSRQQLLVAAEPPAQGLPINRLYRLHFAQDTMAAAISALAGSTLQVQLFNLKTSVVGGFKCPGTGPKSGELLHVIVAAVAYGQGVYQQLALDMFSFDCTRGEPAGYLGPLGAGWRDVLPPGVEPLGPEEVAVNVHQLHPLQLEAARTSGLFTSRRTFQGPDGALHQVWCLTSPEQRRQATRKYLDKELEVVSDVASAARALASCTMGLDSVLGAPSAARVSAQITTGLAMGLDPPKMYEPDPRYGTRYLVLRSAIDQPVAQLQLTARLHQDIILTPSLLHTLNQQPSPSLPASSAAAPASLLPTGPGSSTGTAGPLMAAAPYGAAGVGSHGVVGPAPQLPPGHWACRLASEHMSVARLLEQLKSATWGMVQRLMSAPAWEDWAQSKAQEAVMETLDALNTRKQQLQAALSTCSSLAYEVSCVALEGPVAAASSANVHKLVKRTLAMHYLELYRCQELTAWLVLVAQLTSGSRPQHHTAPHTSPSTPLPSAKQLKLMHSVVEQVARALQQLMQLQPVGMPSKAPQSSSGPASSLPGSQLGGPAGSASASSEPAAFTATASPHTTALLEAAAEAAEQLQGSRGLQSQGPLPKLEQAVAAAVNTLRSSAEEAGQNVNAAVEACRRKLGAGGLDEVVVCAEAHRLLVLALGPVSAALVQQQSVVYPAALAGALLEPGSHHAIQHVMGAYCLPAHCATAAGSSLNTSTSAGAAAASSIASSAPMLWSGAVAQQLSRLLQGMAAVHSVLLRTDPTSSPPASTASSTPWLRSSIKLRNQLEVAMTTWVGAAAAGCGHVLLLAGQRQRAVEVAVGAAGAEAVRVVAMAQAVLGGLKMSRVYDDAAVEAAVAVAVPLLQQHLLGALRCLYHITQQLLITPVKRHATPHNSFAALYTPALLLAPAGTYVSATAGMFVWDGAIQASAPNHPSSSSSSTQQQQQQGIEIPGLQLLEQLPLQHSILLLDVVQPLSEPSSSQATPAALASSLQQAAGRLGWGCLSLQQLLQDLGYQQLGDTDLADRLAAAADVAVVLGPEQELGTLPKWLDQRGVAVLGSCAQAQLSQMSADDLAKHLLAHVVLKYMRRLEGTMSQTSSQQQPPQEAPAGAPAHLAGQPQTFPGTTSSAANAGSSAPSSPSQTAAPVHSTYIHDRVMVQPLLHTCRDLRQRLSTNLTDLQGQFAATPLFREPVGAMVTAALQQLEQQQLMLEGMLLVPELQAQAEQEQLQGSTARAVVGNGQRGAAGQGRPDGWSGAVASEDKCVMTSPREAVAGSAGASRQVSQGGAAMPAAPVVGASRRVTSASTESEDEEPNVRPLSSAVLPLRDMDVSADLDSDAASVQTAASLSLPAFRRPA